MATADRMSAIEHWMLSVSRDGGVERFDDLHVDSIDSDWKSKGAWIDGGVWAFQEAIQLRDRLDLPFTVALGFSLCAERYVWSDNAGIGQLQSQLDWSPPSLYLFRHGEEPDVDLDRAIHSGQVAPDATSKKFSLVEVAGLKAGLLLRFKRIDSDEHTQSAFLLG
jgi:hypothetical protein